jgi:hypothetical protein
LNGVTRFSRTNGVGFSSLDNIPRMESYALFE